MYTVRKVTDDLYYVGGDDRRLALFENIFPIPEGVSYNSYLLMDEKTVLVDAVDWAITREYILNVDRVLDGRELDYLNSKSHGTRPLFINRANATKISKPKNYLK